MAITEEAIKPTGSVEAATAAPSEAEEQVTSVDTAAVAE